MTTLRKKCHLWVKARSDQRISSSTFLVAKVFEVYFSVKVFFFETCLCIKSKKNWTYQTHSTFKKAKPREVSYNNNSKSFRWKLPSKKGTNPSDDWLRNIKPERIFGSYALKVARNPQGKARIKFGEIGFKSCGGKFKGKSKSPNFSFFFFRIFLREFLHWLLLEASTVLYPPHQSKCFVLNAE